VFWIQSTKKRGPGSPAVNQALSIGGQEMLWTLADLKALLLEYIATEQKWQALMGLYTEALSNQGIAYSLAKKRYREMKKNVHEPLDLEAYEKKCRSWI